MDGTDLTPTVEAAISNSDNASAEDLWASLGSAKSAARQVQAVLAETGDYDTIVQSGRVRAGFTPFGQTRWSLRDQARFAWRLPCLPDASPVVAAMRSITASQKWGLASLDQSASKGGWGPDTNGSYLVRQFGIVKGVRGTTGVALVAAPKDGTFASGVNAIEALATWVATHQAQLPQATCEQ
ncbi:hypothetical protein GCM10007298_19400 [Williamsia phyllosphaerae]|uniref:Uncharacterized protein n=1 Tax=Williamsia phyllosphaerae TaxID=885042 RepID=A0ABQ1UNU7_9NOCA|nr:hypothetical protein GCM10007298_19400 [Williamsia phyllosphaerae]